MIPDLLTLPIERFEWEGSPPDLKDKILLIEFWASWCPSCEINANHLNNLYKTYRNQGVEVVGITADEIENGRQFIKDNNIEYKIAYTYYEDFKEYFDGIPNLIVKDKNGNERWRGYPMGFSSYDLETLIKIS